MCAIDLNRRPQRSAHSGHFGAFLCAAPADRELVPRIAPLEHLSVPLFCKIRLLDEGVDETVRWRGRCRTGAPSRRHGRYRGCPCTAATAPPTSTRSRPSSARWPSPSSPTATCAARPSSSRAWRSPAATASCRRRARSTTPPSSPPPPPPATPSARACGGRSPPRRRSSACAARASARSVRRRRRWPRAARRQRRGSRPCLASVRTRGRTRPEGGDGGGEGSATAPLALAAQYVELASAFPPTGENEVTAQITMTRSSTWRACRFLTQYELLPALAGRQPRGRHGGPRAPPSTPRARAPSRPAARRRAESARGARGARRTRRVVRSLSKARQGAQGGRDDFIRGGREPPTDADVRRLRAIGSAKDRQHEWRARFGQHCHGWYLDGACPHLADSRGCGFLHGDADEGSATDGREVEG